MNEQQLNRNNEADAAALSARQSPPFRPAQSRRPCNAQVALPTVPRRRFCAASRSVRAAFHAAEFAAWQASGGDFLRSSVADIFIRAYQRRFN
jgi:hypothetical protein